MQVFAETWGWARVQVNGATSSRRLPPGEAVPVGPVERGAEPAARDVIAALTAAGHTARVKALLEGEEGGPRVLEVVPGPGGLSARWGHGRAFRLYAWAPGGEPLHQKVSVGAVVVRGLLRGVEDASGRPRKTRADRLRLVTVWEGVGLWQ